MSTRPLFASNPFIPNPIGLDAYKTYKAVQLHFTKEDFNAAKYNFSTRVTQAAFFSDSNRGLFTRIEMKYNVDALSYYVSNFIENPRLFVTDLKQQNYIDWQNRLQNFSERKFKTDCHKIFSKFKTLKEFSGMVQCTGVNVPPVISWYLAKEICLETVLMIDLFVSWSVGLGLLAAEKNNPIAVKIHQISAKYKQLLESAPLDMSIGFYESSHIKKCKSTFDLVASEYIKKLKQTGEDIVEVRPNKPIQTIHLNDLTDIPLDLIL